MRKQRNRRMEMTDKKEQMAKLKKDNDGKMNRLQRQWQKRMVMSVLQAFIFATHAYSMSSPPYSRSSVLGQSGT